VKDLYAIDLLHSWHLGPLGDFVAFSLWYLVEHIYRPESAHLDKTQEYSIALMRLKSTLWPFYKEKYKLDEDWKKKGSEVTHPCNF